MIGKIDMNKISSIVYSTLLIGTMFTSLLFMEVLVDEALAAGGSFGGGDGSSGSPYIIQDVWDLQNMTSDVRANYTLGNDINASITSSWNSGQGFIPIGDSGSPFTGYLEGQGYNITEMYINRPGTDYVGIIGCTGSEARITNLTIVNCNIIGRQRVGGLAGEIRGSSTVHNCSVLTSETDNLKSDYYVELDGTDEDYVDFGNMTGFTNGTSWSIIEMVKIPSGADDTGGWHMFRGEAWDDKTGDIAIKIRSDTSTNNVYVWLRKSGWQSLSMDNGNNGIYINEDTWYTICVSYNYTSNRYILYVNGTEVANNTAIGPMDDSTNTNKLFFGGQDVDSSYAQGDLYSETDITIKHQAWLQRVLSPAEVSAYDGWIDQNTSGIFFSTEIHSTGIDDASGNGRNGTNGNSPDYIEDIPDAQVIGKDMEIGGLVGKVYDSIVSSSYAQCYVQGIQFVGGLVGHNDFGGIIKNSNVNGTVIATGDYAGGLVGVNYGTSVVMNSYACGKVNATDEVGGLVGRSSQNAIVESSYASCEVIGNSDVGGLVGFNTNTINSSYATGTVKVTGNFAGGLVGFNDYGIVSRSYSTADVNSTGDYVGGLVGYNPGEVNTSYTRCNVIGGNEVGGLVGRNDGQSIKDSYAASHVNGSNDIGGLVGYNDGATVTDSYSVSYVAGDFATGGLASNNTGTITNCFWDNQTSGQVTSDGGIEKNTIDMMDLVTFLYAGWDFSDIWVIKDDYTYPFFRWDYWNDDPITLNDSYEVSEGDMLEISAPGVLANDKDPDLYTWRSDLADESLEVTGYDTVSSLGVVVTMAANGSFTYNCTGVTALEGLGAGEELVDTFNHTVSDDEGNKARATVYITVSGENDAPDAEDDHNVTDEDTILDVGVPGVLANDTDPDTGDVLRVLADKLYTDNLASVSLHSNGSYLYDPTGSELLQGLGVGDYLEDSFNYTVSDRNGRLDIGMVYVNVSGVNDPPAITTSDLDSATEDFSYSVDYEAIDAELDPLTWSLNTNANWLSLDGGTGVLSGTPSNADVGSCWVNVSVKDENGGVDWSNFTLSVVNVNDHPVITTSDVLYAEEDSTYTVDYDATDADLDTLTWSLSTNAGWLSMDANGWLNGTPANNDVGAYWVEVMVSDGNGGSYVHNFTLTVSNTNDAPVIQAVTVPYGMVGETYTFPLTAIDMDGDMPTWTLLTNATWLDVNSTTGILTGTPRQAGTFWALVTAADGHDGTNSVNLTITILADSDGDGIGDNSDPYPDDMDNDGVSDTEDAYPLDPNRWKPPVVNNTVYHNQTIYHNTTNNVTLGVSDTDTDEDGWNDSIEILAGTDPLDATDRPADEDNDGVADFMDTDARKEGSRAVETPLWAYIVLVAAVLLGLLALVLFIRGKPSINDTTLEENSEDGSEDELSKEKEESTEFTDENIEDARDIDDEEIDENEIVTEE